MIPGFRMYYPFKSHYHETEGGHKLHYLDEGSGDPIVMVHGNPSWSFYYRYLVKAVRDDYRAIVPDHIGMGLSDKPRDKDYTYTLANRVKNFEGLLDALGITENITLVVHDWGGMIGMSYAAKYPERIKRLMILNTAAFHLLPGKDLPAPIQFTGRTLAGAYATRSLNWFARGATVLGVAQPMPAPIADAYCEPYDSWDNRIATLRFVQDIPTHPSHAAYDLVSSSQRALEEHRYDDIPALICWGEQDFVFDMDYLTKFREYLPHAEVHTFEDGGHYVLEDKREAIIPLFMDFLERHPIE